MDYESKYKNALKWARDIYPYAVGADKEDLEYYFPEIKESEDERIRKGLIKAVSGTLKGNTLYGTDVTREEALAWLEKQGGAKERPTWSEEDEKFLNQVIEYVNYALNDKDMFYNGASPIIDWLKSLKQRLGGEK